MSSSSMNMRALARWSAISFTATVPTPWKGEPSRCIAHPLLRRLALEEPRVDRVKTGLVDREPPQRAVRRNHRTRRIRPHVALRGQPKAVGRDCLHLAHAGDRGEPTVEPRAVCLD